MEMDKLIARINELSRINKTTGLSEAETKERAELRRQYLEIFKGNFRQQLDTITIVENEDEVKH